MSDQHAAGSAGAVSSVALVGAAGGVGTTRLTVEVGAILARDGHRVGAFDAALGTQGMVDHADGQIDPDVTDLLTDEAVTPAEAMVECERGLEGSLHLCPARAPFGDLARAKTPAAAKRFETALREATERFDYVLADVPPVATNPAVSAVTTVDRNAVVTAPTDRGADAAQRLRGRLADVGAEAALVVANRGDSERLSADVVVPEGPVAVADTPVAADGDGEFARAVATLAERLFDVELTVEFESDGLIERTLS